MTTHQGSGGQAIDKPYDAVVAQIESLGQFANHDALPARKALNRQQCLMLLCSQICLTSGLFAETHEFP